MSASLTDLLLLTNLLNVIARIDAADFFGMVERKSRCPKFGMMQLQNYCIKAINRTPKDSNQGLKMRL